MALKFEPLVDPTTNELIARLNNVMNQSNLVREIVDKSEELWTLQQTRGNPQETRQLRNEIARLEDLLRIIRQ